MNICTLSDGNHTEGIGSLLQNQLFCYAYCKLNNFNFKFDGFTNLQHFQYTNQNQEQFSKCVTNFCGLEVSERKEHWEYVTSEFVMSFGQKNIDKVVPIISKLSIKPISDSYLNNSNTNVAVHVRKYTKTDIDPSIQRECFNHLNKNEIIKYYSSVNKKISDLNKDKRILYHIYSQGNIEEFEIFNHIFDNVKFHIDEHPIISLYHMLSADVFVMANSSLSYVAHLYGRNKCIAKPSFYHSLYKPNIIQ